MECIVITLLIIAFMILSVVLITSETQNSRLVRENKSLKFTVNFLREENAELRDKIKTESEK